ncbi:hypothetical protein ONZ51_g2318 [Trametes cubensis]|uniref:Uncharacterized protein n=1 Tax=Trametes cubensis TaxID=1111947 RepID=A0AAD7TZU9_9APHY|nr:hypothetical protein ONZ51_g2318 [Trametes cubensis]
MPDTNTSHDNAQENTSGSSDAYVPKSNCQYYEEAGGFDTFMHSYGLKTWSNADIHEGKTLIESFRQQDRLNWEEAQKTKP